MTEREEIIDLNRETLQPRRRWGGVLLAIATMCVLAGLCVYSATLAPRDFVPGTIVVVPEGSSLRSIAMLLKKERIISSPTAFSVLLTRLGKERGIQNGPYLFEEPESVFRIARRFAEGERGIETERVTLPEGLTAKDMAKTISRTLEGFDAEDFSARGSAKEGYLFPDTYFFLSTATSGEVLATLEENFTKKTGALREESERTEKDWAKVVTMASIIEGEAVTPKDRRIVSGILWKRIERGMRLGVDAPFLYIMGKGSLELTESDLATTSPYNTYRNAGLPPTPINNPGIDAIDAALHPESSPYLYYLSDEDGGMHYAKNFEEHKLNKERYLR